MTDDDPTECGCRQFELLLVAAAALELYPGGSGGS